MADTWDDSSSSTNGSYGPRGPITRSDQTSGYTPPDNYSGYRGGISDRDNAIMRTEAANRAANAARIAAERSAYEQQMARAAQASAAQRAAVQAQQQAAVRSALQRQAAAQQAYIASQPATGPTTRGGIAAVAAQTARRNQLINDFVLNTAVAESGGVATAKNPLSSATGLHQFTKGTWNKMIQTYRPDLLEGRTKEQVLALRTDPELSTEMAGNLARENADYLESRGLPVDQGSLYLSHFLGAGTAANVLRASPDTPISNLVSSDAIERNQKVLGGDRTAADVAQWASNKMFASATSGVPKTAGFTTSGGAERDAFRYPEDGEPVPLVTQNQQQQPAQQAGLLDQLFGGPEALQNRISGLEAEGRYAGLDKQAYADEFAGGDVSKVKSRIVDFGQGPVVDYYVKDLGDVAGEAISGLLGGIGNLFGGSRDKAVRGPNEAYGGSAIAPGSIFGNLFSGTPRSDYGPYGNLTAEQYRQQYGGRDVAQLAPRAPVKSEETFKPSAPKQQYAGIPTIEELARSPDLWRKYYNQIPLDYGYEMVQTPLMGPTIRGIFS